MAISNPMKQAALAGKALNITGVIPLYKANGPSFRISSRKTSRIPFGYVFGAAVCNRDLRTSLGIPTSQLAIPAEPPAKIVPISARLPSVPNSLADHSFTYSYDKKYIPLAGTSTSAHKTKVKTNHNQYKEFRNA